MITLFQRLVAALALGLGLSLAALPAHAHKHDPASDPSFQATYPAEMDAVQPAPANGAIFQTDAGYAPLTSGARAAQVGDILTIVLQEATSATKSTSATTGRDGSIGLTPPSTGPLSKLFSSTDVAASGTQAFKGKGDAAQSNALSGELTVTVAKVFANGALLVRGSKQLVLNRGDEYVQVSGIVRPADISPDNRVSSTRVADAHITYTGRGEIARASHQGWLQRFFSRISPF